jgi:hypothetical protein
MSVIFISGCTGRKRSSVASPIGATNLPKSSITDLARAWNKLVNSAPAEVSAKQLYCGRGFQTARKASDFLKAEHWIVSAGLGLIRAEKKVPAYDLTIGGDSPANVASRIKGNKFSAPAWWDAINAGKKKYRSISALVINNPRHKIIISISRPYLEMILEDISSLDKKHWRRIRLIGPNISHADTDFLRAVLLPYDEQLDGPESPIPGTKGDFAQRAAQHFAIRVWPDSQNGSIELHSVKVRELLKAMGTPKKPKNEKKTDIEVAKLISSNWAKSKGSSSRMLRILRDDLGVACEQSRFRDIFNQLKKQIEK